MASFKGRYWLVFNRESANRPVICEMARAFDITFNIRQSNVTADMGIIAIELEGARDTVKAAIAWLEGQGVQVDPVELQTIEG